MKSGSLSTAVFAFTCFAAAALSFRILGPGLWGGVFVVVGVLIGASPYIGAMREPARAIALLQTMLAFLAVILVLLAATTGGSFRLPDDQALLLAMIGAIGALGLIVRRSLRGDQDGV